MMFTEENRSLFWKSYEIYFFNVTISVIKMYHWYIELTSALDEAVFSLTLRGESLSYYLDRRLSAPHSWSVRSGWYTNNYPFQESNPSLPGSGQIIYVTELRRYSFELCNLYLSTSYLLFPTLQSNRVGLWRTNGKRYSYINTWRSA
jgi:hypothetical protein